LDKDDEPERTHKFYLNKSVAKDAALEILGTHFSLKGDAANSFLKKNFDDAWYYYDVNQANKIDAIGCGTFFRYLTRSLGDLDL